MIPLLLKPGMMSFLSRVLPEPYHSGCEAFRDALIANPDHPIIRVSERMSKDIDPRVRMRFFRNFVLGWLFRGHGIRSRSDVPFPPLLLISVTDACNYRCKGCYAAGHEKGHQMDRALVDRLINEAVGYGTNHFVILGGEPFMWPHLLDTLRSHPDCWFQIYTNGSKIDREVARELRRAGNAQIMISLEGLRENTDSRRGEGAYENCIQAMENLRAERMPFGAGITCYKSNLDEVTSDAFVKEMVHQGCLFLWYFWYMPYGDLPNFGEVLTREDRQRLSREILRIRNSYPVISADQIADCVPIGGCSARSGLTLHITTSGLVEACAQMHFSDSTVEEKSIAEILRDSDFLRRVRTHAPDPQSACYLQDRCSELQEIVRLSNAWDNTSGRDTECLASMANDEDSFDENHTASDAYEPLIRFFFRMLTER